MLSFIIFELFYTEDQVRTSNTGLLEKMLYNMKQRMIGKGPHLVLFSAHDTTILSFGRAMDFLNIGCLMEYFQGNNNEASCINQYPIFATNYLVELWQEDDLSHSISVPLPQIDPLQRSRASHPPLWWQDILHLRRIRKLGQRLRPVGPQQRVRNPAPVSPPLCGHRCSERGCPGPAPHLLPQTLEVGAQTQQPVRGIEEGLLLAFLVEGSTASKGRSQLISATNLSDLYSKPGNLLNLVSS